jgi:hypothetical protein
MQHMLQRALRHNVLTYIAIDHHCRHAGNLLQVSLLLGRICRRGRNRLGDRSRTAAR